MCILFFSNIGAALWNCLGEGTFTCEYSFKVVDENLTFIRIICCDRAIWSPQPEVGSHFLSPHGYTRKVLRVPDCTRNDVLFLNCPGTPQWPGVKPVMIFVARPVLLGKRERNFLSIFFFCFYIAKICFDNHGFARGRFDRTRGQIFSTSSSRIVLNPSHLVSMSLTSIVSQFWRWRWCFMPSKSPFRKLRFLFSLEFGQEKHT